MSITAQNILDRIKERTRGIDMKSDPVNPICQVGGYLFYRPIDIDVRDCTDADWCIAHVEQVGRVGQTPQTISNIYKLDYATGSIASNDDCGWEELRIFIRENSVSRVFASEEEAESTAQWLHRASNMLKHTDMHMFSYVIVKCIDHVMANEDALIEHLILGMEKLWSEIENPIKIFKTKMSIFVESPEFLL